MVLLSPYPFERFPLVSREEVVRTRRLVRALGLWRPEVAERLAVRLLGAPLRVRTGAPEVVDGLRASAALVDPMVAAVLVAPERGERVLCEVHPRLAGVLFDRALGGEASADTVELFGPLGDAERGVLAYVAARLLAAAGGGDWRLAAVLTEAEAARALFDEEGEALVWSLDVRLGDLRAGARCWLLGGARAGEARLGGEALVRWRRLPLEAAIVAGQAALGGAELAELRPGDVLVLDHCGMEYGESGWSGEAEMVLRGARRTRWTGRVEEGTFTVERVLRAPEPPCGSGRRIEGESMDQEQSREDEVSVSEAPDGAVDMEEALAAAGDAPVTIGVEIARFTLALEEVAALRPGEIVATGRPVGEQVVLRVGEQAVAVGELVDVEGEVGVRILRIGD